MSDALDVLLTFRTTFRVMAADRALEAAAIARGLTPTPPAIKSPCGLSLRVRGEDRAAVRACLDAAGLEIEAVFREVAPKAWQPFDLAA